MSKIKTPRAERYLELHTGHCTYVAHDERRFATPETIAATIIIGPAEEIVERLRSLDRAGLSQVFINPAFND